MKSDEELTSELANRAARHVDTLCAAEPDRRPGSAGNASAVDYVASELVALGWAPSSHEFDCADWRTDGGTLTIADRTVEVVPSPYGHPFTGSGPLRVARNLAQLSAPDLKGSVLVLAGDIASEPLTPTNYPFYQNEEHSRILDALCAADPSAVVAITGRCPELCGAVDPFPLIEDGDFPIATANVRQAHAHEILDHEGDIVHLSIRSERRPGSARNIDAIRGTKERRLLVMAHIDSKPGTPGAVDNASGVAVILLVAELLATQAELPIGVELLVVNGEDHYAAPGEVAWLDEHRDGLDAIELAINIDGAGYRNGTTSYSTYNLAPNVEAHAQASFASATIEPGPAWYQSDHAIFAMAGRPALAITTEPIADIMATLYHSADDTPSQVDSTQLANTALAMERLIRDWPTPPA